MAIFVFPSGFYNRIYDIYFRTHTSSNTKSVNTSVKPRSQTSSPSSGAHGHSSNGLVEATPSPPRPKTRASDIGIPRESARTGSKPDVGRRSSSADRSQQPPPVVPRMAPSSKSMYYLRIIFFMHIYSINA